MRLAIALILAVAACGGSPPAKTPDKSTITPLDVSLLDAIDLDPVQGFVLVDGQLGVQLKEPRGTTVMMLLDELRVQPFSSVTIVHSDSAGSTPSAPDAPPPSHTEVISDRAAQTQAISLGVPTNGKQMMRMLLVAQALHVA